MDNTVYKCPACGGAMEFSAKDQKLKCPYCDHEESIDAFDTSDTSSFSAEAASSNQWETSEVEGMRIYKCKSCSGEIIAEDTSASVCCPYCGNNVFIKEQFTGGAKPDFIVPFKYEKKQAKEAYLKHLQGKRFLPSCFKNKNHIDEITGFYVPYWLFDASTNAKATYSAENVRVWESGDTEYTETSSYNVIRQGTMSFTKIPVDGSQKMDNDLMESIEPFDFSEATRFTSGYLAGFMADRYDVSKEESLSRAQERIWGSADNVLRDTVTGYDRVDTTSINCSVIDASYVYGLYPVWILNTTFKGSNYVFAMNGQTGKLVGDLPADMNQYYKFMAALTVLFIVIGYVALYYLVTL